LDPPKRSAFNQTMHVAPNGTLGANGTTLIKPVLQIGQNVYRLQGDGMKADRAAIFDLGGACGTS
jgi:hypothetical protein